MSIMSESISPLWRSRYAAIGAAVAGSLGAGTIAVSLAAPAVWYTITPNPPATKANPSPPPPAQLAWLVRPVPLVKTVRPDPLVRPVLLVPRVLSGQSVRQRQASRALCRGDGICPAVRQQCS